MAAGVYDIYIEQGSTFRLAVTYLDPDSVPFDLTGLQGRGQIRQNPRRALLAEFVVTITDAAAGEACVELPAEALEGAQLRRSAMNNGVFGAVYDIELYDEVGNVVRLLEGAAHISPEVTK